MSMIWLEGMDHHMDKPSRPLTMPVFAGQKLVVVGRPGHRPGPSQARYGRPECDRGRADGIILASRRRRLAFRTTT